MATVFGAKISRLTRWRTLSPVYPSMIYMQLYNKEFSRFQSLILGGGAPFFCHLSWGKGVVQRVFLLKLGGAQKILTAKSQILSPMRFIGEHSLKSKSENKKSDLLSTKLLLLSPIILNLQYSTFYSLPNLPVYPQSPYKQLHVDQTTTTLYLTRAVI